MAVKLSEVFFGAHERKRKENPIKNTRLVFLTKKI